MARYSICRTRTLGVSRGGWIDDTSSRKARALALTDPAVRVRRICRDCPAIWSILPDTDVIHAEIQSDADSTTLPGVRVAGSAGVILEGGEEWISEVIGCKLCAVLCKFTPARTAGPAGPGCDGTDGPPP